MFRVKDIMTTPVFTIGPGESVLQAAEYMQRHDIGGLPVVENENLVGIITSRDVRFHHPNRIVADAMTRRVICCSALDTTWDAAGLMEEHEIERLPVLENGKLVGILTKAQLVKYTSQLYDPLTGAYNSAYIYRLAAGLLSKGQQISVILLDVDNFGELNKKYGHIYGDRCLKEIARVLRENTEQGRDYVCRYGGDEFVIVTLKKLEEAETLTSEVISKIAAETSGFGVPVTVSAGICAAGSKFPGKAKNYYEVVENAINRSSLASTKAKRLNKGYIVE